ncbi:hypothetical protein EZJ43_10875 [Pedobacter changchengzhani]|uniref:Uncharacterized protein n=1 Tax=Pedobacter changchengzhani TaxID=2529274 RepID=A0A4R5MJS2_9SPHI|nr:hypothetical protein [Pedobacter changchengzhani]TDG35851.1 hypothetical protein EZJ43_10875 [Pedobacter changchengzhani]
MKTDVVEIFQTLRACLQPYATRGYTAHKNSESDFELWSEKNMVDEGEKVTERFFAGLRIDGDAVVVKTGLDMDDKDADASRLKIENLSNEKVKEVENLIAITHNHFKEKKWI